MNQSIEHGPESYIYTAFYFQSVDFIIKQRMVLQKQGVSTRTGMVRSF